MRHCVLIVVLFIMSIACFAQDMPDYGVNKVRIALSDKTILAEINAVSGTSSINSKLFYYWYSADAIHSTQGGFSGKLLNGNYTEYYPNKNLKEQGHFKKGLKNGEWKSWNEDGNLLTIVNWKNGKEKSTHHISMWKRIPFLKKGKKTNPDTTASVVSK